MAAPIIEVFSTEEEVSQKLCQLVVTRANAAIESKGLFTVGFSGGSAAKFLCSGLPKCNTDWSKWRVFFCDERHVPFDDPECTFTIYKENLLSKVPLPEVNVFPLNPDISVEEAAEDYVRKLYSVFTTDPVPRFDVLVLGMGPDGHTCSLFPGHPLLKETNQIAAAISDSPKPPPKRVTLTFPTINNAKCAVFASCGSAKADIVQKVLEDTSGELLPAARVRPVKGEVIWFLDKGAASKLKKV
ncbi:6-phosphogluconolactonase [Biomphalaria glabrata]|uniref:6-phosphogluconolactonase n=1 Tax=Biomphalaria glabrata TaxID=6526 RepID=A0A2C9K2K9_BIOGL|nr:6-phosphogluconolactonase-like [Biomphalaria glabrata]KAI8748658.1 6-phosphogluconolactonase-like [Biomphalaria glabrata]KAI8770978.1 6-phosphogluconolactonase [Biomphalaria glabrata]